MGSQAKQAFLRAKSELAKNSEVIHHEPESISFSVLAAEEIRALSACNIVNPMTFNALGHPGPGGLYDLRMGPYTDKNDMVCATCLLLCEHCPGHLGHIELPMPVINPLFERVIDRILKLTCLLCHRFRVPDFEKELFRVRAKLLEHGLIIEAQEVSTIVQAATSEVEVDEKDEKRRSKSKVSREESAELVNRLRDYFEEAVEKNKTQVRFDTHTRSVEALDKQYRKTFLYSTFSAKKTCMHCAETSKIFLLKSRFLYEGARRRVEDEDEDDKEDLIAIAARRKKQGTEEKERTELNPLELRSHFRKLWGSDADLLRYLFPMLKGLDSAYPTDVFFLEVLAVPPPKSRPCQFAGGIMTLHPQSSSLQDVVETVTVMKQILQMLKGADLESFSSEAREMIKALRGQTAEHKLDFVWKELQSRVDRVLDKDKKTSVMTNKVGWGFKQLIERKQGLFRMHMMGKRVNFAARTVITPDPNINIDEIGLPEVFAKQLTYRVPVTPWNVEDLRQLVLNGPDVHPGAVFVEAENGVRKVLAADNLVQRQAIAKTLLTPGSGGDDGATKYVYRHLVNGDAMLLNRQPTLHKPSIMAHRARVLKGEKVMRLHYAICKSYNADFDGDEMNAHFPQNELARSEAYNIVNVCKQYLVPKDATPLQGLIQDHIIAGVKMTMRGRFFNREQYNQLVFGALVDNTAKIKTLPPAIFKPEPLWSGKQIISTVILNLVPEGKSAPTLLSNAKIKAHEFQKSPERMWKAGGSLPKKKEANNTTMSEGEVIFRKGEFLSGILDKNQYGATQYGLVHCFFELYGGAYSGKLQSAFSKLFTNFLHTEGFSLGVHDILVTSGANRRRRTIIDETRQLGSSLAANGVGMKANDELNHDDLADRLEQFHRESRTVPRKRVEIDRAYKEKLGPATNEINKACIPNGLIKTFPENNLQLMVQSGAKGSTVNTMQISCLLGQIELEGKRPPLMISGRSLPSFRMYDTQPRAGGFIDGRFMSGIRPQEFFFHCMAGREGLIDTACKTSRSGYLQRCLIKLLEGLVVNYDMTVRDSDGSVIQFQYGEDSMDVCKSVYLKPSQLDFFVDNRSAVVEDKAIEMAKEHGKPEKVLSYKRKVARWQNKNWSRFPERRSGFLRFSQSKDRDTFSEAERVGLVDEWHGLDLEERRAFERKAAKCPDPVTSLHRPDSNFGAVSEKVERMIDDYLKSKNGPIDEEDAFREMIYLKSMQCMVEPGEPVGVLAAQSIGEPSTQMTLNTFHFAGRGEMNVTLGIPRLREILMVASVNIKTPCLTIPFLPSVREKEQDELRIRLNRVTLADLLECVHVKEKLKLKGQRCRLVTLRFQFLPRKMYKDKYCVKPAQVLKYFETKFISKVLMPVFLAIDRDKKLVVEVGVDKEAPARRTGNEDEEGDKTNATQERFEAGEDHASSDEDELPDDADATDARKKNRQMDGDLEEGLSDEEEELMRSLARQMGDNDVEEDEEEGEEGMLPNRSASGAQTLKRSDSLDMDDGFESSEEQDETLNSTTFNQKVEKLEDASIRNRKLAVMAMSLGKAASITTVTEYDFDSESESWCQLTLSFAINKKAMDMTNVVRKAAEKAVIHEVKNIKRAFVGKNDKGEPVLTTEGVNIDAMFKFDHILNLHRLSCNNIHDMARYYGIEAANRTIVREIVSVFRAYGILVDPHHLTLVADFMTFDGTYRPFNRVGIESNPSPLQQMTFETAIGFLRNATLSAKTDTLDSPSSCIVLGKPCPGGTGAFKVVQRLVADVCDRSEEFYS